MPAVLSDQQVCHDQVPVRWKPVLQCLADFIELESRLRDDADHDKGNEGDVIAEIQRLHDLLITQSAALLEPQAVADLSEADIHVVFAKSVFLLMHIAQSLAGDDDVLDTAGCRILHLYEADFLADSLTQRQLRQALAKTVSLDGDRLSEIESMVVRDVGKARRKQQIVRALRDRFDLWAAAGDLPANIFRFFDTVYPQVGIRPDEIDLIVTGTMIFFCLPFHQNELTTDRFPSLTSEQQQPIRDFLARVQRFSQWQFAHFPVFGFRRGSDVDPELLDDLAARCGLSPQQVADEFSKLTAIVPTAELDKYVVHDIWGHSWQACMLGFDRLYEQLATYADPLELGESATESCSRQTVSFDDCFVGSGEGLRIDEERFMRFVNLEVAERLPIAMTPVLAEVLADVAEFKLMAERLTDQLDTSSVLKRFPAKLDLTMRDVLYYFRQATKVFRLWALRPDRRQRTVQQLVSRGASSDAAARAVGRAVEIWQQLEGEWLAPQIVFRTAGDHLQVNVVSRLALNFLAIHRETLLAYRRIGRLDTGKLPLKGFRDLLLISVAVFFEDSPSRNLWRVDEFLSLKIGPLCEKLVANAG